MWQSRRLLLRSLFPLYPSYRASCRPRCVTVVAGRLPRARRCATCSDATPSSSPAPKVTPSHAQTRPGATDAAALRAGSSAGSSAGNSADHRHLGLQQELFTTSVYSPGSPIFLPRGARIFNRLVDFLRKQYVHYGFDEVITPTIYKKALWARSGHLENYADDMFTVRGGGKRDGVVGGGGDSGIGSGTNRSPNAAAEVAPSLARGEASASRLQQAAIGTSPVTARSSDSTTHPTQSSPPESPPRPAPQVDDTSDWGLKPMNCPGHCLIFASTTRSFRDLPIRFADFGALHRDEVSGALSGLTRVRRFHQDDGHIFCRPSQVRAEIAASLDFVHRVYGLLGLGPYRLALSTRPTDGHLIGTPEDWDRAEDALRFALEDSGLPWDLHEGDGAFYGPKIDIVLSSRDGREHQTATIQLDFQLPRRFGLEYVSPAPEREARGEDLAEASDEELSRAGPVRPVLIHRAVLGSVERLMALLIEHYAGPGAAGHTAPRWPFWLNPRQVAVLTVNDSDEVVAWASRVRDVLLGRRPVMTARVSGARDEAMLQDNPSMLAVDLDVSARSVPLKVREAKSKGYGVIAVVGKKNVSAGNVTVDIRDTVAAAAVDSATADTWKREGDMAPEELRRILEKKVALYE